MWFQFKLKFVFNYKLVSKDPIFPLMFFFNKITNYYHVILQNTCIEVTYSDNSLLTNAFFLHNWKEFGFTFKRCQILKQIIQEVVGQVVCKHRDYSFQQTTIYVDTIFSLVFEKGLGQRLQELLDFYLCMSQRVTQQIEATQIV